MLPLTKKAWISFFSPYFPRKKNQVSLESLVKEKANLSSEVCNVEDHWLLLCNNIYVDIREASLFDENLRALEIDQIKEGDIVDVWIEENEVIRTYPALATARMVRTKSDLH
ncbi:hypothetical protein [Halalkalibacter alkaliphilus]|uniref:Uncharacterized protein n=1 Tax=Halalkalibacter alkaliphilus TaxID=2917993 RepID=A0A9X1ZWP0_9BACI|nr:hypothetical protein [Halalkalibacter alkaliphilus]MCL7746028.1 hypothetical protein [Halalkalibacter alkaliphilus]